MIKESLSRFGEVIYPVVVTIFFLFYAYFVLFGIYFGNFGNDHVTLLSVEAAFSGTVLTIFFALFSLSIQNVVGKYPRIFLQRITHSKCFASFLITVVISLSSSLCFIFWGSNRYIVGSSLILTIFIAVSVVYMIYYSLRFLNIAYLIKSVSTEARTYSRRNIRIQASSFKVDDSVCQNIQKMIDPIVNISIKAAKENDEEIFAAGIKEIDRITTNYLNLRKDFTDPYDNFLSYIRDQFHDLTQVAQKAPNQRFIPNIIDSLANMAIATADVRPMRSDLGHNDLVRGFVTSLERIILSEELLKETSSVPPRGCDKLGQIGIELLRKGFTTPVGNCIVPSLSKIARQVIAAPSRVIPWIWKDVIVGRAVKSQMEILATAFEHFSELRGDKVTDTKNIIDNIIAIINKYIDESKSPNLRGLGSETAFAYFSAPLGDAVGNVNIWRVSYFALQQKGELSLILKCLEHFLNQVNQVLVFAAISKKEFTAATGIAHQVYKVCLCFIPPLKKYDKKLQNTMRKMYKENVISILVNGVGTTIDHTDAAGLYSMLLTQLCDDIATLLAIWLYEHYILRSSSFTDEIDCLLSGLKRYSEKINLDVSNKQAVRKLCTYLRMIGSWLIEVGVGHSDQRMKLLIETMSKLKCRREKTPWGEDLSYPLVLYRAWRPKRDCCSDEFSSDYWERVEGMIERAERQRKQFDAMFD